MNGWQFLGLLALCIPAGMVWGFILMFAVNLDCPHCNGRWWRG